jgi:hypothetical protein
MLLLLLLLPHTWNRLPRIEAVCSTFKSTIKLDKLPKGAGQIWFFELLLQSQSVAPFILAGTALLGNVFSVLSVLPNARAVTLRLHSDLLTRLLCACSSCIRLFGLALWTVAFVFGLGLVFISLFFQGCSLSSSTRRVINQGDIYSRLFTTTLDPKKLKQTDKRRAGRKERKGGSPLANYHTGGYRRMART